MKKEQGRNGNGFINWILLGVLFVIALISFIVWCSWHFPNSYVRTHNWGKQVCTDYKGWDTWADYTVCKDLIK